MNQDTKNAMIGMTLIMVILFGWQYLSAPSAQQVAENKRIKDSTEQATRRIDSLKVAQPTAQAPVQAALPDSIRQQQMQGEFGIYSAFAMGQEQINILENDVFKITFTNKGGRIKDVILKKYYKLTDDSSRIEKKELLHLLEDVKNRFEFVIPSNTAKGKISTEDLYFATPSVSGNTIVFRASLDDQTFIEQKYVIGTGYDIDYDVRMRGLGQVLNPNAKSVQLNLEDYLDKLEKNVSYESSYSHLNYKEGDNSPDYLGATGEQKIELNTKPVQWVAHTNQFFTTSIISLNGGFKSASLESTAFDATSADLKKTTSKLELPTDNGEVNAKMKLYIGPKDYSILKTYKIDLEDIVSYGGSILGTINRYIIRNIFDFLHSIFANVAVCILLLTLVVKAFLYPLSYKMLRSQAKTTALKPEIEKLKAKFKDDPKKVQVEQMKIYQEFGVNPLGGCLPTLLQMPIWMALFQFFPASIDFRQQGFLWATDLTGFEEFIKLPFHIPLYGAHISLFALLWGASLVVFTWYSMKDTDMTGQPAMMKQLQYFTPVIFTVMFNSYAAGLSLYMLFSNILNIGQTVVTKNYVIDHEKILEELHIYKKNPKKPSAFRQKLNDAMQQQQAMKEEQGKVVKGKKK